MLEELAAAPFQLLSDGVPVSTENVVLDVVPAVESVDPSALFAPRQPPAAAAVAATSG